MRTRIAFSLLLLLCFGATASILPALEASDAIPPPALSIEVRCADAAQPLGYVSYEVNMVTGGIDEPMTWSKSSTGAQRGRLVNAWRLRLGQGDVVVTSQACWYALYEGPPA